MKLKNLKIGDYVYIKKNHMMVYHLYYKHKNNPLKVKSILSKGNILLEGISEKINAGDISSVPCVENCKDCLFKKY